jgi:hypothetical protein
MSVQERTSSVTIGRMERRIVTDERFGGGAGDAE